ncbi:MAG: AbrB/MazE/SpoVT family DNA-binding domain-containing protein [Clostridia bacterium]|nr:AbrB/MazE/SpoVT family DNA-binding domain-containing protein [Clostridia bacterium]
MGCGMVRKVDELGRVVIPKEMRRVLNIKTGSSIEMFINDDNQVVLKKFSELSNILYFAENLSEVIFDTFNLPVLISDDEQVLICKGLSKKDYIGKKLIKNKNTEKTKNKEYVLEEDKEEILIDTKNQFKYVYTFPVISEGFESGYIFLLSNSYLDESVIKNILVLKKFLSNLLKF